MPPDSPAMTDATDKAALLNALSRLATQWLERRVGELLPALQNAMLDLAGSTAVMQEQQRFLDAMRVLARDHADIKTDFLVRVAAGFARIGSPAAPEAPPPAISAESLELVSAEQVERHVLATGMSNRARSRAQKALFQLHERMLRITPAPFDEHDNPADPAPLSRAFLEACAPLGESPGILRLACGRFESVVLGDIDELYRDGNDLLRDAGILPELSALAQRSVRRAPDPPVEPAPESTPITEPGSGSSGTASLALQEIGELLARVRGLAPTAGMQPVVAPASGAVPANINTAGLMSLVTELQGRATWLGADAATPPDIRQALETIAARNGGLSLAAADQDTISLVTLFFDTVNADRNLPLEIQAMIARLQLPVLRLALRDRGFFADVSHPARQLIDLMARAGLGWDPASEESQQAILGQLHDVVDEVLAGDNGAECYRLAAQRLQEHAMRTEQRARKIERRTAEKAEADARTTAARDAVYQALRERIDGSALPSPVVEFLMQDWQRVMQLFHLRRGVASAEWQDALKVIDDLTASVRERPDGAGRADYEADMLQLYGRLEYGLGQTQSHTTDAESRVDVIRALHRRLVSGDVATAATPPLVPVIVTPPAPIPPRGTPRPDPLAGGRPIGEVLMFESLQTADAVPVGTWFEYKDPRSGITRRCKLSARIEESRTLIFSDRSGATVWEKSRKLFAYELQIGFLVTVEDSSLVDRTLGRIAESLREGTGAAQ